MIKNIVFDFGNVIVEWNIDKLLTNYTTNSEEQRVLKEVIFQSEEWELLDRGTISREEAEKRFEDRVPNDLKGKVKQIMSTWFEKVEFYKEVCDLIKKLKDSGYKVYGLSNASIQFYDYIKELDIFKCFDGIIISAIEKTIKPEEKIYHILFERYSLDPRECFFIDDKEENINGGMKCGMKGFVFSIDKFGELEKELKKMIDYK